MKEYKNSIGIVGYWFATNYGGVASYYSLCQNLKKWGYNPTLIENPYYYTDKEGEDVFSRNFFRKCGMEICEPYEMKDLDQLNKKADIFILGSDQVLTRSSIRSFGKLFLMQFADDDKKRIAVSASYGGDSLDGDEKILEYARNELRKFSSISVREFKGLEITREKLGIRSDFMIDPIFLTTAEQYKKLGDVAVLENKEISEKQEPYLLAYILDPTSDKKEGIVQLSSMLNIKIEVALDGRKFTHDKNLSAMDLAGDTLPELDFQQWLYYFSNASYIITDSFHGASMAIILNKPFIIYANYQRGFPRFKTLIELFNIKERLIESSKEITEELVKKSIDFQKINEIMQLHRIKAKEWIVNAIETDKKKLRSVEMPKKTVNALLDLKKCVGCGSCVSVCPLNAIQLKYDEWGYYRAYVDENICVDCGKCSKVCPALKLPVNNNSTIPECYEFITNDENILQNSSSGGFFTVISKQILKKGGAVVGAAWTKNFGVEHIIINDMCDLKKLQRSKYLQSYMGSIFRNIKKILESKQTVLFSGCPCQVAGLNAYLGKDYDNLLTIDLLCGNAPASGFFKKYLSEAFPEGLNGYDFRSKIYGYNAETVTIEKKNGEIIHLRGIKEDAYQRVYHNHTMCAPHCESCQYQKLPRYGDITIGDFWGLSAKDKTTDVSKGVSVVLCNSEKGRKFLTSIPEDQYKIFKQVPLEWLGGNGYAIGNSNNYASSARDIFYSAIQHMEFSKAVNYALKPNHGEYRTLYENANTALMFDSSSSRFIFDANVWEEYTINGKIILHVKNNQWKMRRYANLPLVKALAKDQKYIFSIRFRIKSKYHLINFHVRDAGTGCIQLINSFEIPSNNDGNQWYEIKSEFVADTDLYDQFMIGASQVSGENNYFIIDYINIIESKEGKQ